MTPSLLDTIQSNIASICTVELAKSLLQEHEELIHRYDLGDFRPSELSGARFGEVAFRVCQQVCFNKHTPVGKTLPGTDKLIRDLELVPASSANDSFRLHIPRVLRVIYDFRNKRDVAHLGKGVSPNFADASLVLANASWIMAEIVRIAHKCDIKTAQSIVDNLVQRRTSLIWSEGDIIRVLRPELSFKNKVLLILHHLQPNWVTDKKLFDWVDYSNFSAFKRNVLNKLHSDALIHFNGGEARILPPGNAYVESVLSK